jgi:imidazolonepropionase-like amidohydrolase
MSVGAVTCARSGVTSTVHSRAEPIRGRAARSRPDPGRGSTATTVTLYSGAMPERRPRAILAFALVCLACCAKPRPPLVTRPAAGGSTVITNVAVFDGVGATTTPARDVLIENGRIARIAAAGTLASAEAAQRIDGAGATVLPGLIDVHGHVDNTSEPAWMAGQPDAPRNMQGYLYCGVTTVFDPADLATLAFQRRDDVAAGTLLGPRIFATGPMFTTPGGHPVAVLQALVPWYLRWYVVPRFSRQIATAEDARREVEALAALKPDAVKIAVDAVPLGGPILADGPLRAIVDEARARGLRTVAHIGTTADALAASDAGVAAWMHGVYKERIPDELVARFVAPHIPYVATVTVFDSYADIFEGKRQATQLEREIVDAAVLDSFAPVPPNAAPPGFVDFFRLLTTTREARCDNVHRVHAAGVTILAGSDTQSGVFPGPGLHRELSRLVECGLSPAEALRAATGDAARFLAQSDDPPFGSVREGKAADLLLVDGDPTRDIDAVHRIRDVFLGGVRLERHPLARAVARVGASL